VMGLPSPGEIIRATRRPDDPYPPDNGTPNGRRPPTIHQPTNGPFPDPSNDPGGSSRTGRRRDDSISGTLDQLYMTADSYLKELADKSGGRLLRADTLVSLPDAFAKIAGELRTQYAIGYYPTNTAHDGQYRKIKVVISRKQVMIRTRPGYRAPSFD
jgi:hypothetical protein